MRSELLHIKKIEKKYDAWFLNNLMLKDEIEKKLKKKDWVVGWWKSEIEKKN